MAFFKKKKKKSILEGSRRNPCKIYIPEYTSEGLQHRETYGFIQERDVKNQMYYVMLGNGGDEQWYDYKDVELVKGHWTNKPRKTEEDEN